MLVFLFHLLLLGAEAKPFINDGKRASEMNNDITINKMKTAAVTALSAAAVKAKLLADQEEEQIHRLTTHLIEKQVLLLSQIGFLLKISC